MGNDFTCIDGKQTTATNKSTLEVQKLLAYQQAELVAHLSTLPMESQKKLENEILYADLIHLDHVKL